MQGDAILNDAAMEAAISAFRGYAADLQKDIVICSWLLILLAVLVVAITYVDGNENEPALQRMSLGFLLAVLPTFVAALGFINNFGINPNMANPQPAEASIVEKVEPKARPSGDYGYEAWIFDSSSSAMKQLSFEAEEGARQQYVVIDCNSAGHDKDGNPVEALEASFSDDGCRCSVLVMTKDLALKISHDSISSKSE